jgi:hypothetical protein
VAKAPRIAPAKAVVLQLTCRTSEKEMSPLSPAKDPSLVFEAGWTEHGAVCVNHPRVAGNITLSEIEARWPQLAGKTGAICTEAFARSNGALLFNRSAP